MKTVEKEFKSVETLQVFNAVSTFTAKNDLPFEMQWELDDLGEAFEKYAKRFIEDRNKLIKKHGGTINQTAIDIPDENGVKFSAELVKLTDVKVKISFKPFDVKKLKELPKTIKDTMVIDGISMKNLRSLGIFTEGEKEEKPGEQP